MFEVPQQHLVNPHQYFIQLQLHGSKAAHVRSSKCHDQSGAKAMSFSIGHDDHERAIRHGDEVEVITPSCVRWMRGRPNVKAWHYWWNSIKMLLHIVRQL